MWEYGNREPQTSFIFHFLVTNRSVRFVIATENLLSDSSNSQRSGCMLRTLCFELTVAHKPKSTKKKIYQKTFLSAWSG